MTFKVQLTIDSACNPHPYVLDLDTEEGRRQFQRIDFWTAAIHLYNGEQITIECIDRDDED